MKLSKWLTVLRVECGEASNVAAFVKSLSLLPSSFLWNNSEPHLNHARGKLLSSRKTMLSALQGQPHVVTVIFS